MYGLKTSYLPVFSNHTSDLCKYSNQPKIGITKNQNLKGVSSSLDSKKIKNGESIVCFYLFKSTHKYRTIHRTKNS